MKLRRLFLFEFKISRIFRKLDENRISMVFQVSRKLIKLVRGLNTLIDNVGILSQELGGADKLLTRFYGT